MDFKFRCENAAGQNGAKKFTVTGPDSQGGIQSLIYLLPDNSHPAYNDFHAKLSSQFGTRLPASHMEKASATFQAPYQEILTDNISPDILYGYGDPCVIRIQEDTSPTGWGYYLTVTSNDAPDSFPILHSADLQNWTFCGFIFPQGQKPEWTRDGLNVSDFWAPEIHKVGVRYVLCFTAREKDGGLAIGLAEADHPAGPYKSQKQPILTGDVIDSHIYIERDGTPYLFWKEDNNGIWPMLLISLLEQQPDFIGRLFAHESDRRTAQLMVSALPWLRTLEPMERFQMIQPFIDAVTENFFSFKQKLARLSRKDGVEKAIANVAGAMRTPFNMQPLDPHTLSLTGERRMVIENDQEWEGHLIEGMYLIRTDKYYLFYSGNDFATDKYGIGVATSDTLTGPYQKQDRPLLQSTAEWSGPGHPSVVPDLNGNPTLVMHGFPAGTGGYKVFRALLTAPLAISDGRVGLR